MQLDRTGYDDGWGYSSQIDAWVHEDSGVYYRRPSGMRADANGLALTRGQQGTYDGRVALDDERGITLIGNPPRVDVPVMQEAMEEFESANDQHLRWKKFPVLDDGFVTLVDWMGDDDAVVQAARVSYGRDIRDYESIPEDVRDQLHSDLINETSSSLLNEVQIEREVVRLYNQLRHADSTKLLRFLMRMHHTTPFEMCEVKLLVRCPMDVWRQWIRHRTASVNEYSTRYTTAIDSAQRTKPDEWRLQSKANKQGSRGSVVDWPTGYRLEVDEQGMQTLIRPSLHGDGEDRLAMGRIPDDYTPGQYLSQCERTAQIWVRDAYDERLRFGIASEQARKDLPLSTYTEAYWKIDLHNLFHFLGKRMDSAAQLEIRSYANVIGEQIVAKLFPECWQAFLDYRLNAMTLSAMEVEMLRRMLGPEFAGLLGEPAAMGLASHERMDPKREFDDFKKKLSRLVGG